MQDETRTFPLRVIISVTTGRLLTKSKSANDNGISDMYKLLEHMTNDAPWTHQLPRFANECRPWLLRWFPELEPLTDKVNKFCDNLPKKENLSLAAIDDFITCLEKEVGKEKYDVPRIPMDDHEKKDPLDEFAVMLDRSQPHGSGGGRS